MIGPVELPFDGCPPDACADMITGDCPTEAGETLVYDLDFEVIHTSSWSKFFINELDSVDEPLGLKAFTPPPAKRKKNIEVKLNAFDKSIPIHYIFHSTKTIQ